MAGLNASCDGGPWIGNFLRSERTNLSRSGIFEVSRFHSGLPYGSHQTTAEDPALCASTGGAIVTSIPRTALRLRSPTRWTNHSSQPSRPRDETRFLAHSISPDLSAETRLDILMSMGKRNQIGSAFAQRVDFERLRREVELAFKLGICSPVDVPNCDTMFEVISQWTVG